MFNFGCYSNLKKEYNTWINAAVGTPPPNPYPACGEGKLNSCSLSPSGENLAGEFFFRQSSGKGNQREAATRL
ncbi:hypothetical protein Cal6303_1027 [Calothrix sp. PCC 6303]|nr:hypothetical protein Cal6303_1027 [Calothrix sp. PCC 6303]